MKVIFRRHFVTLSDYNVQVCIGSVWTQACVTVKQIGNYDDI